MVAPAPDALLLIDGYNVIGAWPQLQAKYCRYGLEPARQHLIESMTGYAAFHGCPSRIVFDAQYQRGMQAKEQITKELEVCFTDAGQTADTYIEVTCAQFRHEINHFRRIIVATSDRDQQRTITGYGAEWMSAHQLIQGIEKALQSVRDRTQRSAKQSRRLLSSFIDPEAKQKLERLRFGLDP